MLAGTPIPKLKAKSAEANAIVPIGRSCADMVLASPSSGNHVHPNSNIKRYKLGNPALLSAHFADAVSPEKSNCLMRAKKKTASSRP
jgi:hypothetical protein